MMVSGAPLPGKKQMELLPSLRTLIVRRSNGLQGGQIRTTQFCKIPSQSKTLSPKDLSPLSEGEVHRQHHLVDQSSDEGVSTHG